MKHFLITIFTVFFLIGILLITGCRKPCYDKFGYVCNKIAKKLNLSDEQTIWFEGFVADLRTEIDQMKNERKALRDKFKKDFTEGTLTQAELNTHIEKKLSHVNEKVPFVVGKLAEVHENLTPEQRNTFVALVKEFKKKKEKRIKHCRFFSADTIDEETLISHITKESNSKLDLNDKQQEWLQTLLTDLFENHDLLAHKKTLHKAKKDIADAVINEFTSISFNAEKLSDAIISKLPIDLIKNAPIADTIINVQTNLNKKQRAELIRLHEKKHCKKRKCWFTSKKQCAI